MAQRLKTDWVLFISILVMLMFGLVFVYSATIVAADTGRSDYSLIVKQGVAAAIGLVLLLVLKWVPYSRFCSLGWASVPLGLATTLAAAAFFIDKKHRWISLGPAQLQASEFVKPALFITLAYLIYRSDGDINHPRTFWPIASLVLAVTAVVGAGDFGTAAVLMASSSILLWVAGLNRQRMMIALAGVAVLSLGLVISQPFRLLRVLAKVDPKGQVVKVFDRDGSVSAHLAKSNATKDMRYQAVQSTIALGSGGAQGVGLMQGRQKLAYLPEKQNDFIFAVIGEELGLAGCLVVVLGLMIIAWRGLTAFLNAPNLFGKYLALGLISCFAVQALINMTVVLDLGPTKGLPLPLISYGGCAMVSSLISMGLLLSVSDRAA